MTRIIGWTGIATLLAWSVAAVLVSGADAGLPHLGSSLLLAVAYWAFPRFEWA